MYPTRSQAIVGISLAATLAAVAVAFADSSIVVLALPDLLRQFDASITGVAWVVTSYNLALAAAALALVRPAARIDARALARAGAAVFFAASVACGGAWGLWPLVVFRSAQGVGAALLLVGTLPLVRAFAPTPARGTALWAGASVFGAALGPAAGGLLTELFTWRAIFFAQAPLAGLAFLATFRDVPRATAVTRRAQAAGRFAGLATLALISAALVGLLFLSVLVLIDVWHLSPLRAAAVVTAIPAATLLAQLLPVGAGRGGAIAGVALVSGGLAAMAFLPALDVRWAASALAVAGFGLGLVVPRLNGVTLAGGETPASAGALSVFARHAGLVAGLVVTTPLLAADLSAAGDRAELRGVSTVLDAPVSAGTKIALAVDLVPVLGRSPRDGLPSFTRLLASRPAPVADLGPDLDHVVQTTVTRGFRRSFLVSALLAALALVPLGFALPAGARSRRRPGLAAPAIALGVAAALVGAELARGAANLGTTPRLLPPCAARASPAGEGLDGEAQRRILQGLDAVSCSLGKSREQFVVDVARSPAAHGFLHWLQAPGELTKGLESLVGRLLGRP